MAEPILKVENLHCHYGEIHAVKGVSLSVDEGEIVAIIGSNGAGKTTILRTISGLLGRPTGGTITFMGKSIERMEPYKIPGIGLVQVLEGRLVFPQLTVMENLMMGAYLRKDKQGIMQTLELCLTLFPRLKEREAQSAGTLSGGEQQMLAVARALMSDPKVVLMDEPSMGLAPLIIKDIFSTITKINERGITVVLVEQNSSAALNVANRAYVLETGSVVLHGTAQELLDNQDVKKAYLGLA